MISLETYFDCRQKNSSLPIPIAMEQAVTLFLKEAAEAVQKDVEDEGVSFYHLLQKGENFKNFYAKHADDFEAFGYFLFDHRGVYDKDRQLYNWEMFYPFVWAVFNFGVKMPYRSRLIEMTKRYDLACFAMDDPEVCQFVAQNFKIYADIKDTLPDEHGRAQTILERLYVRLHTLNHQRPFTRATPQWCLLHLIYEYLYTMAV